MRRVNEQIGTTDIYYKVGYQCLGPLLVGFSQWLHEKTKDVDKLCSLQETDISCKKHTICYIQMNPHLMYIYQEGALRYPNLYPPKTGKTSSV